MSLARRTLPPIVLLPKKTRTQHVKLTKHVILIAMPTGPGSVLALFPGLGASMQLSPENTYGRMYCKAAVDYTADLVRN